MRQSSRLKKQIAAELRAESRALHKRLGVTPVRVRVLLNAGELAELDAYLLEYRGRAGTPASKRATRSDALGLLAMMEIYHRAGARRVRAEEAAAAARASATPAEEAAGAVVLPFRAKDGGR